MINALLDILIAILIVSGIIVLLVFCYWMIWNGLFSPVNKLARYKDRRLEAEHEFNVIKAEESEIKKINAEAKELYGELAVKIADLRSEAQKLEEDITRKQKVKKQHEADFKEFNKWKELQEGK